MLLAVLVTRIFRFRKVKHNKVVDTICKQLMGISCNDDLAGERAFRDSGYWFCVSIARSQIHRAFPISVLTGAAMGDLVNLKRFKKRREREHSERQGDTNRALHGRTKTQRAADEMRATRERALLDKHRIDGEDAS